jgi:type IX secretion system PorP/SprF family membrane protein
MGLNYKKTLFFLLSAISLICTKAQDLYYTRKYYINPAIINPAISGAVYTPRIIMLYDKQFPSIEHSPETYSISGQLRTGKYGSFDPRQFINESKFKFLGRVGLGGGIFYDKDGPLSLLIINIAYAYHIPLKNESQLSFGLSGILYNYRLHSSEFEPYHLNDPFLYTDPERRTTFNTGIGMYYTIKTFFTGLSFRNVLTIKDGLDEKKIQQPDYYYLIGYQLHVKSSSIIIEPSFMIKKETFHDRIVADSHLRFYYKSDHWCSVSYRDFQNLNFQIVINVYKSLYVGYSYENVSVTAGKYNLGSHGIVCGINLGLK